MMNSDKGVSVFWSTTAATAMDDGSVFSANDEVHDDVDPSGAGAHEQPEIMKNLPLAKESTKEAIDLRHNNKNTDGLNHPSPSGDFPKDEPSSELLRKPSTQSLSKKKKPKRRNRRSLSSEEKTFNYSHSHNINNDPPTQQLPPPHETVRETAELPKPWPLQQKSSGNGCLSCCGSTNNWGASFRNVYPSLTYSYMNQILHKGRNQFREHQSHLTLDDLYQAPPDMAADVLAEQFRKNFNKRSGKRRRIWPQHSPYRSILGSLWHLAAPDFVPAAFWELLYVICRVSMPLSLRQLLLLLEEYPNQSLGGEQNGLRYAIFMSLASFVAAVAHNRVMYLSTKAGIRVRAALTSAIYEHSLRLSPGTRATLTTGEITNLVAIDTQKLYDVLLELHNAWSCPLLLVVVTALLWWHTGAEMTIGVAILLLFLPIVKWIVARMLYLRKERSKLTDVRINVLASMLQGIRVTKLNHYEQKVEGAVKSIRRSEIKLLKRELTMWGWVLCAAIVSPMIATATAFIFYALRSEENLITPSKAFSSLLLLSILRFPINLTARLVGKLAQANEGMRRISLFLNRPVADAKRGANAKMNLLASSDNEDVASREKVSSSPERPVQTTMTSRGGVISLISTEYRRSVCSDTEDDAVASTGDLSGDVMLQLENGTFAFAPVGGAPGPRSGLYPGEDSGAGASQHGASQTSQHESMHGDGGVIAEATGGFTLHDINLSLQPAELIMVVGKVGSGKTLLLNALLGELPSCTPDKTLLRIQATLSYAPQIPFILNQSLRENVLFGSKLEGQESWYQRVLEACCLTEDLELIGGDGVQIGERGVTLSGGQKARVGLARACFHARNSSDAVVLLDDPFSALDANTARAVFDGLFRQPDGVLVNTGTILVTHAIHFLPRADRIMVLSHGASAFSGTWAELRQEAQQTTDESACARIMDLNAIVSVAAGDSDGEDDNDSTKKRSRRKKQDGSTPQRDTKESTLMAAEEREYGIASMKVWLTWFANAGGWTFFLTQVVLLIMDRGFYVASDWWLAQWSDSVDSGLTAFWGANYPPQTNGRDAQVQYATTYAAIVVLSAVATAVRSQWSFKGGARCAKKMFYGMTHSVLRAPMVYFETTPLGRILNRFTYDVEVLDVELSVSMTGLLMSFSWLLTSIIVMVVILPWIIFGIVPVATAYFFIQQFYRMSGPDLQRLDAISRSPLQAGLAEGLEGTATIRAFGREDTFAHQFRLSVDKNTSAMLNFLAAQRWLGLRIELLGVTIGFALTTTIVCCNGRLEIAPGLVGLVIQWAVVFSAALNFFFLRLSESEARITSIERANETSQLQPEAAWETDPQLVDLDESWPSRGELVFEGVSMRYRKELPLSLDSVTFRLRPGMRCGIVGRTGSGKSSLTVALFRLVEIETGRILLDGVDLAQIGLTDLRGRPNGLRILPQDPVLYAGTIRDCLDPFHVQTDDRILDALQAVRHRGATSRGMDVLKDRVEEGGSNFSVGERQLLCLARAIVEEPRVLVLDEATASVDASTDAVIQEMLRTRFQNTTLFTVAHRLQTIMDYDVVAVMEKGSCVEFGLPRDLLKKDDGVFTSFVEATGPESAAELRGIANNSQKQ